MINIKVGLAALALTEVPLALPLYRGHRPIRCVLPQRMIEGEESFRASGTWRRPAIAPQAGQQCCASLVVAHDHDDSEHNHDSNGDLEDKSEATTLLAAALTVSHWPILAIYALADRAGEDGARASATSRDQHLHTRSRESSCTNRRPCV